MRRARKDPPRKGCPPEPPGWLLEARGNARPRGMIVGAGSGRPHRATELGLRSLRPGGPASKEAGSLAFVAGRRTEARGNGRRRPPANESQAPADDGPRQQTKARRHPMTAAANKRKPGAIRRPPPPTNESRAPSDDRPCQQTKAGCQPTAAPANKRKPGASRRQPPPANESQAPADDGPRRKLDLGGHSTRDTGIKRMPPGVRLIPTPLVGWAPAFI